MGSLIQIISPTYSFPDLNILMWASWLSTNQTPSIAVELWARDAIEIKTQKTENIIEFRFMMAKTIKS